MDNTKVIHVPAALNQPSWCCEDCGQKYGRWYGSISNKLQYIGPHHCATYHIGECGVCGRDEVVVTEARDFGYLIEGWQPSLPFPKKPKWQPSS